MSSSATSLSTGLALSDARLLLETPYLPMEAGVATTADGMHHVAASAYMKGSSGAMMDWCTYIGGYHLVHEYFAGDLAKLQISFLDPAEYFGPEWKADFKKHGYFTAICGQIGNWNDKTGEVQYIGHLIHLIQDEPDGARMRSRFWLGDIAGLSPEEKLAAVPKEFPFALLKHTTEEMTILATILPDLHAEHSKDSKQR